MSIETQPLKLAPYQRRLLADGASILQSTVGGSGGGSSGATLELPAKYLKLIEAVERGASISQLVDVVSDSGRNTRFETVRRFLLLLADNDLLLSREAQRLADSLAPEAAWPESLASIELFEKSIVQGRLNPASTNPNAELISSTALLVLAAWSATALPFALNVQNSDHLPGSKLLLLYVLTFCGSRSLYALISWVVTFFSGFKSGLSFVLEPSGPRLKAHLSGAPFSLLTSVCLILGLGSLAFFAKLALLQSDAITASWVCFFSLLALIIEGNPFSVSALTSLLKTAYAKNENETSVSRWHIVCSFSWTILYSLTIVLALVPALTSLIALTKTSSGIETLSVGILALLICLIVIASLIDLLTSFSYDEKTGGSIRRLWSRKSGGALENVRSTKPTQNDLEKLPFLRQIETSVRQKLVDLAEIREIPEGQAVCRQGSNDRALFLVLEGRLAVAKSQKGPSGSLRRKIVAFLDPGAVFGESAFFFGQPRTADVVAMEAARVLVIPHIEEMKTIDASNADGRGNALQAELQTRIWFLQSLMQSKTFKELPSESLDAILVSGQRVVFPVSRRVIQEGEAGDACYFIVQGQASVTQNSVAINKMKAGDAFGEIAVLQPGKLRTATVTADSELIAIKIEANQFWHLLKSHLPLALEIERLARQREQLDQARAALKARRKN